MKKILLLNFIFLLLSCNGMSQKKNQDKKTTYKVTKTEAEWKALLTPEQFYVMRQAGTERAFSSPLNKNYESGTYVCVACKTPLFKSENKFDSGTGWPSFDREIKGNIAFAKTGSSYTGIEVHCAVCGGHLGHVFDDGPKETTGKRFCIDGVALKFIPAKE